MIDGAIRGSHILLRQRDQKVTAMGVGDRDVQNPGRDRGIVLIAVLWMLLLVSVLALSFARTTRTEIRVAGNMVENARAQALAERAINLMIMRMIDRGETTSPVPDGRPYRFDQGQDRIVVRVQDEAGKVDLNAATQALVASLFQAVGVEKVPSMTLAAAVLDWRDPDDLRRQDGAEAADYHDAGLAFGPKNADFQDVSELRQVLGVTPEIYARVAPALTVYSGRSTVDTAVAPELALRAVFANDDGRVSDAMAMRDAATERDTGRTASAIAPLRNGAYTIQARVETGNGTVFVRDAVVQLTGDLERPVIFLAWSRSFDGLP